MSKVIFPILFAFLVLSPMIAKSQDEPTFLLPVSPSGEKIDDIRLLTSSDREEMKPGTEPLTAPAPTTATEQSTPKSQKIIDQKQIRFQTLHKQLQELTLLWEQARYNQSPAGSQFTTPEQATNSPEPQDNEKTVESLQSSNPATTTLSEPSTADRMPPDHPNELKPSVSSAISMQEHLESEPKDPEEQFPVTEIGPIDRYSLATSLFAAGHYNECQQTLDAINLSKLKSYESIWVSYLKAGCHRKLGETEEANRLYRRLVADPESDWLGNVSRWWLDHLQDRQTLDVESLTLTTAIKQWGKTVDELAQ